MNEIRKRLIIDQNHIKSVLTDFGIKEAAASFRIVSDWQEFRGKNRAVRIVVEVLLSSGRKLAVRFLNEQKFILDVSRLVLTTEVIERQSEFSELLIERGILAPKKYCCQGRYCRPYEIEGVMVDVTVEEWLDGGKSVFEPEWFGKFGELLGQIHQISKESGAVIGFSIVYDEVEKGLMDFQKILGKTDFSALPGEDMERLQAFHEEKKKEIAAVWALLPRGAVQGDVYSCNNLVWKEDGRVGIYDFNIAGDEVFLGDLLHAWYRTIYDSDNEDRVKQWNLRQCRDNYLKGYEKYRKLTEPERQWMEPVSMLLETVYAARLIAEYIHKGEYKNAQEKLKEVLEALKRKAA